MTAVAAALGAIDLSAHFAGSSLSRTHEAIDTTTVGRALGAFAVVAVVVVLSGRFSIELRGGGKVSLALPALLAAPAVLDPALAAAGIIAGLAVGLALDRPMPTGTSKSIPLALPAVLVGIAAHVVLRDTDLRRAVLATVLAGGLVSTMFEVTARVRGLLGMARSQLRETLQVVACLASGGALLGVTAERGGPFAGLIPLLPMTVLAGSYRAAALARRVADETLDALATIPEVAGNATPGHAPRLILLVEAIADARGLSWDDREALRTAARLHRLDRVLDDPDPIFAQLLLDAHEAALLEAVRHPARRTADGLAAVLRVADTFAALAATRGMTLGEAITLLRNAHRDGAEALAADELLGVLDRRPRLLATLLADDGFLVTPLGMPG